MDSTRFETFIDTIVRKRIDEMRKDIEKEFVGQLERKNFSVQIDKSILKDSEAVLSACVRCVSKVSLI